MIEDTIILNGIQFRFIDTAGIRDTKDKIESLGIERAYAQIRKASVILLLIDLSEITEEFVLLQIEKFSHSINADEQVLIPVFNKMDEVSLADFPLLNDKGIFISAKNRLNLDALIDKLASIIGDYGSEDQTIVTNVRHYEILKKCDLSLVKVEAGLALQIPGDLLAMDIRETLHHLGEITGQISTDDLLGNIFANFCIGK